MSVDPLDVQVGHAGAVRAAGRRWTRATLALGLSPTPLPGLVLLPLGAALGPHGVGLLSPTVLGYLDPAVSVAIAALGVLVGLGLDFRRRDELRLLAAASLEAALTMLLVGGGVLLALGRTPGGVDASPWLIALLLGICAAASSTSAIEPVDRPAARIGDLDDLLPIVAGGLALVSLRESDPGGILWLTAQSAIAAIAIAAAGWLLVSQSASDSEQRVFTAGTLLLLGGAAEFLSHSALLLGLVAGVCWNAMGDPSRERIARDVRHVQHPLVVLLLLVAGARVGVPPAVAVVSVTYLIWRTVGKMAGGWIAGPLAASDLPRPLGLYLLSPGVIAVAFALNTVMAAGSDRAALVLAVAVAGSIGSEVLSLLVHPRETRS